MSSIVARSEDKTLSPSLESRINAIIDALDDMILLADPAPCSPLQESTKNLVKQPLAGVAVVENCPNEEYSPPSSIASSPCNSPGNVAAPLPEDDVLVNVPGKPPSVGTTEMPISATTEEEYILLQRVDLSREKHVTPIPANPYSELDRTFPRQRQHNNGPTRSNSPNGIMRAALERSTFAPKRLLSPLSRTVVLPLTQPLVDVPSEPLTKHPKVSDTSSIPSKPASEVSIVSHSKESQDGRSGISDPSTVKGDIAIVVTPSGIQQVYKERPKTPLPIKRPLPPTPLDLAAIRAIKTSHGDELHRLSPSPARMRKRRILPLRRGEDGYETADEFWKRRSRTAQI